MSIIRSEYLDADPYGRVRFREEPDEEEEEEEEEEEDDEDELPLGLPPLPPPPQAAMNRELIMKKARTAADELMAARLPQRDAATNVETA